jgi:hypothetical protein
VVGRIIEGVGGTIDSPMLLLAGVMMVKLMFPIFRRGGVGGLTKAGDAGADVLSWSAGGGAVEMARPRLYEAEVLTARFFKFRGLFAGVTGLWVSTVGSDKASDFKGSSDVKREAFMAKLSDWGDCGDGPGEGSVMDDESKEAVVVGEDSVESEAEVEVLFRG